MVDPEEKVLASASLLSLEALVRNPSLAQMMAAWQAASARHPQVTSLDDGEWTFVTRSRQQITFPQYCLV